MRDRIATSGDKARERALFSCIASSIPNVEGHKVSMCFQALSGQIQSTQDLVGVVKGFSLTKRGEEYTMHGYDSTTLPKFD